MVTVRKILFGLMLGCLPLTACAPDPATTAGSGAPAPTAPVKPKVASPAVAPPSTTLPSGRKLIRSKKEEPEEPLANSADFATPPDKLKKGILERPDAARMIATLVKDSTNYGPTLVVWLVDRSASCREMVGDVGRLYDAMLGDMLPATKDAAAGDEARLLTAVCSFGADVKFEVEPPSSDPTSVATAIGRLDEDRSGKEVTFTALQAALEKYLPYRTEKQREVIFVVVSDEAGDDAQLLDKLIDPARRAAVPVYVIGVPAPFGRDAALDPSVEMGFDYKPSGNWLAIRQGPESRASEMMRLGFWGGAGIELSVMDSGFGPFALERLCRATGGKYLALRPDTSQFAFVSAINTQWPSPGMTTFDPEIMRRYQPDYVSEAEYQELLSNKARRALVDAGQLGEMELLEFPQTVFNKADEATMARVLSEAQQISARLSPMVDRLYGVLEKGEGDRANLTQPRWQAGFDLAFGRAAAAKAKVDGYNHMLAALKRGKPFQNASSNAWVLEPADEIEGASALQKLIDKSKQSLQRVVQEHAGTPWAKLAERELQTPCGWKWVER